MTPLSWRRQADGSYRGYITGLGTDEHRFTIFRRARACWDMEDVWSGHVYTWGTLFDTAKVYALEILNEAPKELWHPILGGASKVLQRYIWEWSDPRGREMELEVWNTPGGEWRFTLRGKNLFKYEDLVALWPSPQSALEYAVEVCDSLFKEHFPPSGSRDERTVYELIMEDD